MIKGSGSLISDNDEKGLPIPFLTTAEVLKQIEKFGFIVEYDLKSNLPDQVISYLSMLYNLGYDKISQIGVRTRNEKGQLIIRPTVIVMKSCEATIDLMKFNRVITEKEFSQKLDLNVVINVTNEPDMVWDWLTYMANIRDILEENIDPTDDFETKTNAKTGHMQPYQGAEIATPEGFSIYIGEDDDDGEEI